MQDGRKEIRLDTQSQRDRILQHLQHNTFLPLKLKEDEEVLKRWEMADDLLRQWNNDSDAVAMLMNKFDISKATAYQDVRNAKYIWGTIARFEKEYERRNMLEWNTTVLSSCFTNNDFKNFNKAFELRMKLLGLDRDDPEAIDWSKVEAHIYNIVYDPAILGAKPIENIEAVTRQFLKQKKEKAIAELPEAEIETA